MTDEALRAVLAAEADPRIPPPRAIVFDWDNTLVDTWPNITATMNATLAAMGQPTWSPAEAKKRIARSLRVSFPELFCDRWEEARDIFYAELERGHLARLAPLPGAEAVLAHFHAAGVPLAVVSNKTAVYLHREVAHLGWEHYFSAVFGAGELPRDKPAPDAVFAFLARAGLAPGRDIWFVGDSSVDVEIAHAAGCASVLVWGGEGDMPACATAPTVVVRECAALPGLAGFDIPRRNT